MSACVMVIDGNPIIRKLVRLTLDQEGYRVLEAPSGASALQLLRDQLPDLILQDVKLPDVDGFRLIGELRARQELTEVPILALAGLISRLDEVRVPSAGFDDVISKPIDPSQLRQIVRGYLKHSSSFPHPFGMNRQIILVDDEPIQLKLARVHLERMGFQVISSANGHEALEKAARTPPAAIVSDVMMPGLDGFALCMAARANKHLAQVPILLVTSSYVEVGDRELARRAGATDFVVRTPDLDIVIEALRKNLDHGPIPIPSEYVSGEEIQRDHRERLVRQLERQVTLNSGISQRCATLQAELAILGGISEALARHQDFDHALNEVMAACFDAGGISAGALYILAAGEQIRVHAFSSVEGWDRQQLEALFEQPALLQTILESVATARVSSSDLPAEQIQRLFAKVGVTSARVVPLTYGDERLGALLITSDGPNPDEEGRGVFTEAVASQIGQALVLARTFANLKAALRQRDDFLSIAAHELRTPLTSLRLHSQSLIRMVKQDAIESIPRENLAKRMGAVNRGVERLQRLIDSLLDVSRISTSQLKLEMGEFDLSVTAQDVLNYHSEEISRAGCQVSLATPGPVVGTWDQLRIEQVVENLLSNAIKYGAGGPVQIDITCNPLNAQISVRDRGLGIPEEDQERIFKRYVRLLPIRHYGGFGLGLWIVQQIVEEHHGTVAVSSNPGEGSLFTVTLPLHPTPSV